MLSHRADILNQLTALIHDLDSNMNDSLKVIPLRRVYAERIISALVANAGSGQAIRYHAYEMVKWFACLLPEVW